MERLNELDNFAPFQEAVNERDALQKKINAATDEDEKALYLKQLKEVDEMVK